MNKFAIGIFVLAVAIFQGCAGTHPRGRQFIDSSLHEDSPPDWVRSLRQTWEKDGKVLVKTTHTVKGDERVNGCFDLAKLDAKENLLSEIANDVKGSIDNAQQSISENAEVVLGKVRSGEFEGKVTGLRFSEQYYERYSIGETERIDCHTLGELSKTDYDQIKRAVINKVVAVDPRLKEAITKKQIDFFDRKPAGDAVGAVAPAPQQ